MSGAILRSAFEAHREPLCQQLGPDRATRRASALISSHLDQLADEVVESAREPGIDTPVAERRELRELIGAVRTAITHALGAVRIEPAPRLVQPEPPVPVRTPKLFGFLLRSDHGQPTANAPLPPPRLEVDTNLLLDATGCALEAVDRAVDQRAAASPPGPWERDQELVDVMHGLLSAGAAGHAELALKRIANLEDKLRLQHGITLIRYDGANPDHDARLFDFPESLPPGAPGRTVVPALVAGGQLLRRGEAGPPDATDDGGRS